MANTIDPGQPVHNPRPSVPLESQPGSLDKDSGRTAVGEETQAYLQQAKQDVEEIRQQQANSDDPEPCLDAFVECASRETGAALSQVVERLCSAYEGHGVRRRIEPMLRKTGQRIQTILQRCGMSESAYSMLATPLRRINKALDFNGIPPFEVPVRIDPLSSQVTLREEPEEGPPPQDKRP